MQKLLEAVLLEVWPCQKLRCAIIKIISYTPKQQLLVSPREYSARFVSQDIFENTGAHFSVFPVVSYAQVKAHCQSLIDGEVSLPLCAVQRAPAHPVAWQTIGIANARVAVLRSVMPELHCLLSCTTLPPEV